LGLHRIEEAQFLFENERVTLSRHLWRSIFVLDRLVCEFVDRPTAVHESDFPEDILLRPPLSESPSMHLVALDAVVKSSQAMGQILQGFNTQGTIDPRVAQEALDETLERNRTLPESLNCFRFVQEQLTPAEGLAILYVNLLDTHCKLLATRPFFLHTWIGLLHSRNSGDFKPRRATNVDSLSQSCLEASMKAINMIYNAFRYNWLPKGNAFVINFLFASTMIIMSNELVGMYENEQYFEAARNALVMAEAFSSSYAQGQRVYTTLSLYAGFIEEQRNAHFSPQSRLSFAQPAVSPNRLATIERASGGASPTTIRTPASEGSCGSGGAPLVPLAPRAHYVESPQSAASVIQGPYGIPPWPLSRAPSDFSLQGLPPNQCVSSAEGSLPYCFPPPQATSVQAVSTRQPRQQQVEARFVPYQAKADS
jgi:hypothetical protein